MKEREINERKRHRIWGLRFFLAVLWLLHPQLAQANTPTNYIGQSLRRLFRKTAAALNSDPSLGLGGVLGDGLLNHQVAFCTWYFNAGQTYYVFASGDDDARDLDIYISDTKGNLLAKDETRDAAPVVKFTPKYTGAYKVGMRLYEIRDGATGSFCALTEISKAYHRVSPSSVNESLESFLSHLDDFLTKNKTEIVYHEDDQNWLLYGEPLRLNNTAFSDERRLTRGNWGVLAGGGASDLDIWILNKQDKYVVRATQGGAPRVVYNSPSGGRFRLRLDIKAAPTEWPLILYAFIKLPD